jgi:hypothetical protein
MPAALRGSHWAMSAGCAGRDFLIGAILLYGYVYTAYKYGNPLFGRNDFFRYQEIILHPLDLSAAPAPFVLRQIPSRRHFIGWVFTSTPPRRSIRSAWMRQRSAVFS